MNNNIENTTTTETQPKITRITEKVKDEIRQNCIQGFWNAWKNEVEKLNVSEKRFWILRAEILRDCGVELTDEFEQSCGDCCPEAEAVIDNMIEESLQTYH